MKKLLLLLALLAPSAAHAQCNGIFPNNTVCGNVTGSSDLPGPTSPTAFLGAAGGTNGQIQYNNNGALGGFGPITGDFTLSVPGGVGLLATVNANVGTFGSASSCATFTVNGKGLITAVSAAACNPSFTQSGTGAVPQTFTQLNSKIYTPEMFGATCSPYNTPAGSIVNRQVEIQAAIDALSTIGGGTLQFGPCVYGIGGGLRAGNNIILNGVGVHGTTLLLQGGGNAVLFINPPGGGGIVSNCAIKNLSINSADTTNIKFALIFVDSSQCFADNLMISAYPTGQWTATGATAVGINTQGRELGIISNVQIYADRPIVISSNPNFPGDTEDLDSWVFRDIILVGQLAAATRHVIETDTEVGIFNTKFEGHQNWIGGIDGFHWTPTTTAASFGVYFSGIKDEQPGNTGGWSINIAPTGGVYGVSIRDSIVGIRNGVRLRNTNNVSLDNYVYTAAGTNIGMDADLSTNLSITFKGCTWVSGTTATLGAFTTSALITPTGMSNALPATGVLYK